MVGGLATGMVSEWVVYWNGFRVVLWVGSWDGALKDGFIQGKTHALDGATAAVMRGQDVESFESLENGLDGSDGQGGCGGDTFVAQYLSRMCGQMGQHTALGLGEHVPQIGDNSRVGEWVVFWVG